MHFTVVDGRFRGDTRMYGKIESYDPDGHKLVFAPPLRHSLSKQSRGEHRQCYAIQNLPALIAGPGEYAYRENGDRVRSYLWPHGVDLRTTPVEGSFRKHALLAETSSHVSVEGLEATRTVGSGIRFREGHHNRVARCLADWTDTPSWEPRKDWNAPVRHPMGIRLEGTDGWVLIWRGEVDAHQKNLLQVQIGPRDEVRLREALRGDFIDSVRQGRRTCAPVEIAHRSTTLCSIALIGVLHKTPAADHRNPKRQRGNAALPR